jgi:hypothetical protein
MSPPRVLSFEEEGRLMPKLAEAEPYILPFVTLALGTGMRDGDAEGQKDSVRFLALSHLRPRPEVAERPKSHEGHSDEPQGGRGDERMVQPDRGRVSFFVSLKS